MTTKTTLTRRDAMLGATGMMLMLAETAEAAAQPLLQWFLYRETGMDPQAIREGEYYRLSNNQLVAQLRHDGRNRQVGGVYWGWISRTDTRSEGTPQVRLFRMSTDPNAGEVRLNSRFVQTNENVALRFGSDRRGPGHLLYSRGATDYSLDWQKRSTFNPMRRGPDIYQWQVRRNTRRRADHRKRDLREETIYSLYNTVARRYLIAVPVKGAPLRWDRGR